MSQEQLILNHLKSGKSITAMEALDLFGCFRLASRISDLRKTHPNIKREWVQRNGKLFASYKLGIRKDLFL